MGAERLGRYTVLRHLASGGMADVLLARTDGIEGFARHVVLKRIRGEHAKDRRFIQMFLDEARLAASLHHQNIVQVHDIGEVSGEYYFAMEYIHGEDLRKVLSAVARSKVHMPLAHVVAIVSSVAAGLHYAHERRGPDKKSIGIVHRDVSPSNILVAYDGAIKIVDFGIAKASMRQAETRSGSLKGKVSYMSPEQCKGEPLDRRSDVYSLGVVLYELATTTRLFKGDNDYLMMDAIVQGKIPLPRVRRPDLPNDLSQLIMRALSNDPARRFQTADELRVALDQYSMKANLAASTSAVQGYMHKLFGDKPEPWLDASGHEVEPQSLEDSPTQAHLQKQSWTDLPSDEMLATPQTDEQKTRTDGSAKRGRRAVTNLATADTIAPPMGQAEAGPSGPSAPLGEIKSERTTGTKLGWEKHSGSQVLARRQTVAKALMFGLPVVAVAAVLTWHFALRGSKGDKSEAAPVAAVQPGPTPTPNVPAPPIAAPTPVPAPVAPDAGALPPRVAGALPDQTLVPAVAHVERPVAGNHGKKLPVTPAPAHPDPAHGSAAPVVPAVATNPTPTPPPQPVPTPPPANPGSAAVTAPAPQPAEVEAPIAHLSNATIAAIASDHAKQLSKCEGLDELHGEVSVTFQIDGSGKVVKSQLASTIKNPKVAACILRAVQGWQFPKPPMGSAKGVYTMSYQ